MIAYHGGSKTQESLLARCNRKIRINRNDMEMAGIFWSTDKQVAEDFTADDLGLYQADLQFSNPLEIECDGAYWSEIPNPFKKGRTDFTDDIVLMAAKKDYDGVIFHNLIEGNNNDIISTSIVTFDPSVIKNLNSL